MKCDCGMPIMSMGLNRHIKTNKHKTLMENKFLIEH